MILSYSTNVVWYGRRDRPRARGRQWRVWKAATGLAGRSAGGAGMSMAAIGRKEKKKREVLKT